MACAAATGCSRPVLGTALLCAECILAAGVPYLSDAELEALGAGDDEDLAELAYDEQDRRELSRIEEHYAPHSGARR